MRTFDEGRSTDQLFPPSLKLSIVIPVFNEVSTIGIVIDRVRSSTLVDEIIVVDDGSKDGTLEVLRKIESRPAERPVLRVFAQSINQGKGAALKEGFAQVRGDIVVIQDADLEYSPEDYPKLIEPILSGEADVVYGSRFSGGPRRALRFWHSIANRILTFLSNMTTNLNLSDMETGYKAFRSDVIRRIPLRSRRFGFEPEVTAKIARLGCRVYEVPITYHGRTYDEGKKIGILDAFEAVWIILKYWIISDMGVPPSKTGLAAAPFVPEEGSSAGRTQEHRLH
jgi:glycosyltransferase involved in cell wall biosynthesis